MATEDRRTRAEKMRRLLEPQLGQIAAPKPAKPAAEESPGASPEERAKTGLAALLVLLLGIAVG